MRKIVFMATLALASACALSREGDESTLRIRIPGRQPTPLDALVNPPSFNGPASSNGFDCYAVNVSGPSVQNRFPGIPGEPIAVLKAGGFCPPPGIYSPMVKVSTGGDFTLKVTSGPERFIQVLGLERSAGCVTDVPLGEFLFGDGTRDLSAKGVTSMHEVGRAIVPLFRDTRVQVPDTYDPGGTRDLKAACPLVQAGGCTFGTIDDYQLATAYNSGVQGILVSSSGAIWVVGDSADVNGARWTVRLSTSGGGGWSTPEQFQTTAGYASVATQAVELSGKVLVVGSFGSGTGSSAAVRVWNGTTWATGETFQITSPYPTTGTAIAAVGTSIFYASQGNTAPGSGTWYGRRSTDLGATWGIQDSYQKAAGKITAPTGATTSAAGSLFFSGYGADATNVDHWLIRKSTNQGLAWSPNDDFLYTAGANSRALGLYAHPSGAVFAVGSGVGGDGKTHWLVRRSLDDGVSWATVDDFQLSAGSDSFATAMSGDASSLLVAGTGVGPEGVPHWVVRVSRDGGNTWATGELFKSTPGAPSSATAVAALPSGGFLVGGRANDGTANHWIVRKGSCF